MFKEFLNEYFTREWKFYNELVGRGKHCNGGFDEDNRKVKFDFVRVSAVLDSAVKNFKVMKVIKVFERFNKVMKGRRRGEW